MLYPAELKTLVENDIYVIIRIIFCQDFFKENLLNLLEQVVGIEPTFPAWKAGVLPIYDTCIFGAKDGTRTRNIHLGKVALYQLSHFRIKLVQMKGVEPPRLRR